ncbi:hypothetical protein C8039_05220 [Halogeometricum sp. wsp3]|nr:hypothetical protein C8039_05220 [Halogeometricum sp. wsp3]
MGTANQLGQTTSLPEATTLATMQARAADSDRESPLGVVDDIRIHVHFDGPASLHSAGITTVLSFQEPTSITVGFVWDATRTAALQVPATPEGLATAITHLSGAHHTMQPSRSHPELRGHPPKSRPARQPVFRSRCDRTVQRLVSRSVFRSARRNCSSAPRWRTISGPKW